MARSPRAAQLASSPRSSLRAPSPRPPKMPSDFCTAVRLPFDSLSRRSDTEPVCWGKLDRLPCTAAASTLYAYLMDMGFADGYGLRGKLPSRPTLNAL